MLTPIARLATAMVVAGILAGCSGATPSVAPVAPSPTTGIGAAPGPGLGAHGRDGHACGRPDRDDPAAGERQRRVHGG